MSMMNGLIGFGETNMIGKGLLVASGVLTLVGGPCVIAGGSIGLYRYVPDEYGGAVILDLFFNKMKTTTLGVTVSEDLFECFLPQFPAAMAMCLIGGILALLSLALLAMTVKFEKSMLRFLYPAVVMVGALFVVITLILAFTPDCDDNPIVSAILPLAKPHTGFKLIIAGLVFIGVGGILGGVQAFFFAAKAAAVGESEVADEVNDDPPQKPAAQNYSPTPASPSPAGGWMSSKEDEEDKVELM